MLMLMRAPGLTAQQTQELCRHMAVAERPNFSDKYVLYELWERKSTWRVLEKMNIHPLAVWRTGWTCDYLVTEMPVTQEQAEDFQLSLGPGQPWPVITLEENLLGPWSVLQIHGDFANFSLLAKCKSCISPAYVQIHVPFYATSGY